MSNNKVPVWNEGLFEQHRLLQPMCCLLFETLVPCVLVDPCRSLCESLPLQIDAIFHKWNLLAGSSPWLEMV